ncbi:AAA family ATPase [Pannus brasiliensis CCIBt3594]|uniref:AAA family ATPase n=1 Tax=Pannus brasiliensis CCIBt3594 TaxID=1427578 RepID=A0AAW9QT90_9CHRO
MLKSFQIKNFRLFQHIEVKKLNRVNLIVGKNNSGKSTFLEAVELYISNSSPYIILDLIFSRQETWISEAQTRSREFGENPVRHLFFGHKLPQLEKQGILLGEANSNAKIHISKAAYQKIEDNEGIIKTIRVPEERVNSNQVNENLSNVEFYLVAEEGEKTRRFFSLHRDIKEIRHSSSRDFYFKRHESDYKYIWQIVSTENMSNKQIATLWDLTILKNLDSEVISAMKLIDNRVSRVVFVEDIDSESIDKKRIPLVKIKGIDEPLPLKSMGDGMTRLFHIIVALVNAQNGILLIDEFENGLHWSVQPKLWDIIFQLSEKLNVQIFATTHSRDCIQGFDSAWNKYPELGAFFRLDNKDGVIKVTEYTSETLTDALEMDVEVR